MATLSNHVHTMDSVSNHSNKQKDAYSAQFEHDRGSTRCPRLCNNDKRQIVENARFQTLHGIPVLSLKGTPYEMGYQHGFLLSTQVEIMVTRTALALPAFIASLTGEESFEDAMKLAWEGQEAAEPYVPIECLEELKGMADGAQDAGATNVTLKDVLLWNTYYDQWCIYCHPHYWQPKSRRNTPTITNKRHGSLAGGGGCSSFCAWGDWAGGDGRLIFGKNEDNFNMPFQLENRILVVAKPDTGYGHVYNTFPGLIGLDGGLNEEGFQVMTQLNSMKDETMEGCGIAIFTRLLLRHCQTVQDAIEMLEQHPRCTGIAWHVADGRNKEAAIVETSSKRVCVRYPQKYVQALWQCNHSNCFPGWEGYKGYNMVADQQQVNELENIGSIQDWQQSLRDSDNIYVQAPSRFERYRQLLMEKHRGNITVETAIQILMDRYDPFTQHTRDKHEASKSNNVGCTICALYPDIQFVAPKPLGHFKARIANMWSMVSHPETGVFWLAMQDFPAQYGGYQYFNIHQLLEQF